MAARRVVPDSAAFFKPQIVPENLQDAAEEIANNIVSALQKRTQPGLNVQLSAAPDQLIYSNHPNKLSMEMRDIGAPSIVGKEEGTEYSSLQL